MKLKIKPLPAVMTVLSAVYIVYVLNSRDTTLVADSVGGDPGGKVLPMVMGIFMFLGFLYITIKERPDGKKMDRETLGLFFVTLGLSVAYVFLLRPVGFIIMSVVLLYTLLYIYTTIGETRSAPKACVGGVGTLAVTAAVYMLMRYITRTLSSMGRTGALPEVFKSSVLNGVISAVLVVVFTVILNLTAVKLAKNKGHKHIAQAAIITFACVLLLYVVFKQFFSVALAPGLLNY